MIKTKHIFLTLFLAVLMYSCGDNTSTTFVDDFDHEGQALKDNDSLVKFLKNHYFNAVLDSVKPIDAGQESLFDDSKLKTMNVTENEIDYKLYVYVGNEGDPDPVKGFPTVMDSVFVSYGGRRLVNTDDLITFENNRNSWFILSSVIKGWTHGFTNFKGGKNISIPGEPITFENEGKGILFIPSGLAYRNNSSGSIPGNSNLIFYINLLDIIENTDADADGLSSILEDPDGDGNPFNDDTDQNGLPNYADPDDDGDGKLTKDEDKNGNGDPRDDFNDPDNPTLPDYLNPNIFG